MYSNGLTTTASTTKVKRLSIRDSKSKKHKTRQFLDVIKEKYLMAIQEDKNYTQKVARGLSTHSGSIAQDASHNEDNDDNIVQPSMDELKVLTTGAQQSEANIEEKQAIADG